MILLPELAKKIAHFYKKAGISARDKISARVFRNNAYMLNLAWRISPGWVMLNFTCNAVDQFGWVFNTVIFMRLVISALERGAGFSGMVAVIALLMLVNAAVDAYQKWFYIKYTPEANSLAYEKLISMLFSQAANVDLSCYEDPEFYNKYTLAAREAVERMGNAISSISDMVILPATVAYVAYQMNGALLTVTMMLEYISENLMNCYQNALYINNLRSFLEYRPAIPEDQPGESVRHFEHVLELCGVSFSYKGGKKEALHDINIKIRRGEKIAIVGHNGAGKSTLIKLLLRFYDPTSGEILLDGRDIRVFDLQDYRRLFSVAFQDQQVFSMSVADNVSEDMERAIKALKQIGLWDRVQRMPYRENSTLTREFDPDGVVLSGGETQKLAIARAYARDFDIGIFDEPSAALDPIAEYRLFESPATESHPYFYHIRRYQQNEAVQSFIEDDSAAVMWLAAEKKPEWFSGQYKNSVNYTLFGKIYSTSRNMLGLAAVMVDQQYLLPSIPGGNEEDQTLQLLDRQEMTAEIGVDFMEDYDTLEASGLPAGHLIKADHLYFYHYLPEIQKLLVYRVSLNDLKNSMQRSIIYNLLIMMICFAIFIVAFIYFFRLIFIRLRRMISIMHKVIQGDVKIRIPDDRPDELGQLARDMNGLIDMNNELIEKMLMKERLRKEAQISALQYQINPHFIYNTLDAFQMRLIKEKMYWIADLLADFGKILRYNLSDKTQETTLGEELNLIRKYLNLQKISTSQEIELELSIDESLKKYPVIKFLLQPVVENSIKYGRNNNRLLKIEITIKGLLCY